MLLEIFICLSLLAICVFIDTFAQTIKQKEMTPQYTGTLTFYVGILPEDEHKFKDHVYMINEDVDHKFHATIVKEFDDPAGYYTYCLKGTMDAYKSFTNESFVKSLNYDDIE